MKYRHYEGERAQKIITHFTLNKKKTNNGDTACIKKKIIKNALLLRDGEENIKLREMKEDLFILPKQNTTNKLQYSCVMELREEQQVKQKKSYTEIHTFFFNCFVSNLTLTENKTYKKNG